MEKGLTSQEARKRLERFGKNEIKRTRKINPMKILAAQFTSPLILILVAAAVISFAIGFLPGQKPDIIDGILILAIVFASGVSGFFQNYKAEKTIEALRKMATPKTRVIRDGKEKEILATEIVPGDLILIESGDVVPADSKLLKSFNLKVDESALTGESKPVSKKPSDRIFMNTFVNVGRAKALVKKIGMNTKVGKIAGKLQEIKEEKTPFQTELSNFSKKIFWAVIGIAAIIALIGFFKYSLYQSLLTAISLAVAAIPEGLPAVIVLTLAIGAKIMVKNKALIRKLSMTESIGSVDIICADKTGTITKNEMAVTNLFFDNKFFSADKIEKISKRLKFLFLCGALCNNSSIIYEEKVKKFIGDPTEIALRKIADKAGLTKEELENKYIRINEISFTSKRKMMSVVCKNKDKKDKIYIFSKGAPEILIEKCDRIYQNGKIVKITPKDKKRILEANKKFASNALRVLGFAFKRSTANNTKDPEKDLVWLGLQAMIDSPRKGVKKAIKTCQRAGIRIIMMTGDNPLTAKAIAAQIGLKSSSILEGKDFDVMNNKEIEKKLDQGVNIFARISPFHKLRILEILRKNARVVMTGDGVNDALALKRADVGVAMGIKGTEVAKEASDMILLDDNFITITKAVKEGRRIFDNIRKFVNYLFVCNFAEIMVLFLATLFLAFKEPILLPVQILWINLLTDGMPALALGCDPARPGIMLKKPRKRHEPIINKRLAWLIGAIGAKKTIILFATFFLTLPLGLEAARTTLFTGFVLYEFVRIGSIRYQEKLSWLANKWLLAALIGSVLLQLLIIYSPLNVLFHIHPLGLYEWVILIGGIIIGYISAIAITKLIMKFVKD